MRTSLERESKGQLSARSWRVCTGRGTHQDSPLHWWALTFKGHWRMKWPALPQYKHNPRAKRSCLCCGVSRSRPSCMGLTSAAGDSPHRMTRPPGGATERWVDGAGGGGLDGPPHGAQGWSGYPAPVEDPPQLVRRRWPHLVPQENEHAARPHSSRKPPLKSETEWHSRWQNTSPVTTETAEPPPHPPGLIGRKALSSPDKNPQM